MPAHTQWLFNLRHSGTKLLNEFHIASIDTYVLDTYLHTTISVVQVGTHYCREGWGKREFDSKIQGKYLGVLTTNPLIDREFQFVYICSLLSKVRTF